MIDKMKNYTDAELKEMVSAYEQKKKSMPPVWFMEDKLNEMIFAECLLTEHPMHCVANNLYEEDGTPIDLSLLKISIMNQLTGFVGTELPKRINRIIETIKIMCHTENAPADISKIHVANGTLLTNGSFTVQKEFSTNRLPISFIPNAPYPEKWLAFLSELLESEDIVTLQEFMGYCLIPTNKAQKMMLVLGNGGEGKSRLGIVLKALLGDNMTIDSVQRLETDRFARADMIGKLVMFDDDMVMEALSETHILKSIITLEGSMNVEQKNKQSFQASLYARIFAVGNGNLSALHDRSDGFFRRQIILMAKPKPTDRVDDPFLVEKMLNELEGIFLWCFEGLQRLLANDYHFTISDNAKANLREAMEDGNNILSFMRSTGYVRLEPRTHATSSQLYGAYSKWCEENCLKPLTPKSLTSYLKQNANSYGLTYSTNIDIGGGRKVRGFYGIHTQIRTE